MAAGPNPAGSLRGLVLGVLLTVPVQAAGNSAVFDIGSDLDLLIYAEMMTLVIVALAVFDLVLEHLEEYLHHHKSRFHQRLFHKTLKELMILGTISFVLFILKDQNIYDQSDDTFTNTFDFVNLFLFFVGVSLVLAAVLLVTATTPLKNRWDFYANTSLERLLGLHMKILSKPWSWYATWPPRFFVRLRESQVIEYHLFRSVFVRLNSSLLTPAFDYARYSASIVDEIIIVFFDVNWASWLLAVIVLFITLPISTSGVDESSNVQVTALGAFIFGMAVLVMELITCGYINYAYGTVIRRMGVVGGFKGIDKVLQELWVEPVHYMGMDMAAIDVKDLLKAAPIGAPTRQELTASVIASSQKISHAQANFKARHVTPAPSATINTTRLEDSTGSSKRSSPVPASSLNRTHHSKSSSIVKIPCPNNGSDCLGCFGCDPLHLPPGRVQECGMDGDPFTLSRFRPSVSLVKRLPGVLKSFKFKIGGFDWFRTLFGTCTLLKCYYCAFYFSYAIGSATESSTTTAILWTVLTPLPILLCLIPLAKRTLPIYAQLGCLQGEIVWELVSHIEEQQEMAKQAREKVLTKLQETLAVKTQKYNSLQKASSYAENQEEALSPRFRAVNEWFTDWDRDGNGTISRKELEQGLRKLDIFMSEAQLKELFRLADPDRSKSIDLDEFRIFLADLQSLETEPERFQIKLASRLERSARTGSSRSSSSDEFGLYSESFTSYIAELNLPRGGGRFRMRPMSPSCVDDLPRKGTQKSRASFFRETAYTQVGSVDITGVGAEVPKGTRVPPRSTYAPSLRTAIVRDDAGVELFEAKTDDVLHQMA